MGCSCALTDGATEPIDRAAVLGLTLVLGAIAFAAFYDPLKSSVKHAIREWREQRMWNEYQRYQYGRR